MLLTCELKVVLIEAPAPLAVVTASMGDVSMKLKTLVVIPRVGAVTEGGVARKSLT